MKQRLVYFLRSLHWTESVCGTLQNPQIFRSISNLAGIRGTESRGRRLSFANVQSAPFLRRAPSGRCPFPSAFHAGFSFALKSSRMLAQRQLLLALISSQPIHLQYDPVGESRHGPLSVHSLELRASKVLPVGEVYGV